MRDCPGAIFVSADAPLEAAAKSCAAANGVNGHVYRVKYAWQAFIFTEYDLVLKSDLDIDLYPPENDAVKTSAKWQEMLPIFTRHHRRVLCLAHADHNSPLNTGLMLIRPSKEMYAEGIQVLRECSFNFTTGWNFVGRPRSLGLFPRHLDGQPATDVGVGNEPLGSRAYVRNDWHFVAAELDQGFMWYMLYIRHDAGRYIRYTANVHHKAIHWWFSSKPWVIDQPTSQTEEWLLKYQYGYLQRASLSNDSLMLGFSSCAQALRQRRREIESHPHFRTMKSFGNLNPPWFPVWR